MPVIPVSYTGQVFVNNDGQKMSSVIVFSDGSIAIFQYISEAEFNKVYPYYNQIGSNYTAFNASSKFDNTYAKNWRFFGPTDSLSNYPSSYTALQYDPDLYLIPDISTISDGAASFSAVNKEYLTVASNATLQTGDIDFEVGAWVNLASTGSQDILSKQDQYYFDIISGKLLFGIFQSPAWYTVTANTFGSLSANTWYFIRAWHDSVGNTLNISINGVTDSVAHTVGSQTSTAIFEIGKPFGAGVYFNGKIDSAYFKKSISTTAEATALYNAGAGRTYADLTAANGLDAFATALTSWWDLGEEEGTRYDSKGTNHLTSAAAQIIAPPVYGNELIVNGGFETAGVGDPDFFGTWLEYAGTGAIANEATNFRSGAHAVKLSYVASSSYIRQPVTVTAGASYYVSFWTRGDGTHQGQYRIYDVTNAAWIAAAIDTGVTGTDYALVSGTFTAPAGCTGASLYLYSPISAAGDAYFDDVSIKQITTASINNGGFDTLGAGGADVFASWAKSVTGTSTVNDETAAPYYGAHSARFDIDASNSISYLVQTNVTVGRRYKATVYAKVSDATGAPTFKMGGNASQVVITPTTTYAQYTVYFIPDTTGFYISRHTTTSKSFYIDQVTLESLGPIGEVGIAEGLAQDGYTVSRETDQSGNVNNFTQATFSKRPNLAITGIDSKPTIEFDGVDDALVKAVDLIGVGDATIVAVIKPRGFGGASTGRVVSNGKTYVYVNDTNDCINVTSNDSTIVVSATNSIVLNSSYIIIVTRSAAGLINIYINGTLSGSADQSSGTPVAGSDTYVGNRAAFDRAFNGWIGELLIYPSILTSDQRTNVTTMLANKYSITI